MSIPENIASSVSLLLQPYGVDFSALLKNAESNVERKYLTAAQASIYSGLSQKTIRDKALSGVIRSIRIGSTSKSRVLIEKKSIDEWLSSFNHKITTKESQT